MSGVTVQISPQKASKAIQFFQRGPQPEIAKKTGVMHEVDSLRNLAVELHKNKLTADEANECLAIRKLFDSLNAGIIIISKQY